MHQILNFTLFEYFSLVQFSQVFPPSEWSLYYLFFHCCIIYALVCFQDLLLHHSCYLSHFMTVIMHNRPMISQSYAEQHINNQRQNELRHFSRNWAFLPFTDLKRGEYSFSSPIQCCAAVWATYRKQQTTRTLNGGSGGGVWILLFFEVTLFEYNVSTILSPIVAFVWKWVWWCLFFYYGKLHTIYIK